MAVLSQLDQNINFKDARLALLHRVFGINTKQQQAYLEKSKQNIKALFSGKLFLFDSGRSALTQGLMAIAKLQPEKKEVLVSGYTCIVVVNAILKAGLKPVYVDINPHNFNLSQSNLKQIDVTNCLALIIQNTFGIPDNYKFLTKFCEDNNLFCVEDLAHTFISPADTKKYKVDLTILSFGAGKIITSSRGGALISHKKQITKQIFPSYQKLEVYPEEEVKKHLNKIIFFYWISKFYFWGGKHILALLAKLNFFPKIVTLEEKKVDLKKISTYKFNPILSFILYFQLHKIHKNLDHRKKIVETYQEYLAPTLLYKTGSTKPLMGFPIKINKPKALYKALLKSKIQLSLEWSHSNIVPRDINLKRTQYIPSSCAQAEKTSRRTLYLPTHSKVSVRQAKRIAHKINKLNLLN